MPSPAETPNESVLAISDDDGSICLRKDVLATSFMSQIAEPDMNSLSFDIECLACSKKLHCPMSAVGKKIKCPKCGTMMMAEPLQNNKGVVPVPQTQPKVELSNADNTELSESDIQQADEPVVLRKSNANNWVAIAVIAILLLVLAGTFLLTKGQNSSTASVMAKVEPTKTEPPVEPIKAIEPNNEQKKDDVQDKFPLLKARGIQAEETSPPVEKTVNQDAISAMALWSEYEENVLAAENKYGKKLVKVTGKVYGVTKNELGKFTISFVVGPSGGGDLAPSVFCEIRDASKSDFAEVKKGMEITIICKPLEMNDMETAYKGLGLFCVDATLVK